MTVRLRSYSARKTVISFKRDVSRSYNQLSDHAVYTAMKRRTGHAGQLFSGSQELSTVGNDPLLVDSVMRRVGRRFARFVVSSGGSRRDDTRYCTGQHVTRDTSDQ